MSPSPDQPLVSVITIFLDARRFFAEAVDSVLRQTYANWELLLVDDGSTDGTSELARGYAARYPDRIRYLDHPEHDRRGMSASRNLGILSARGALIGFLDADDVWLPDKLETLIPLLAAKPEAAMVAGTTRLWYGWTGQPSDAAKDAIRVVANPANKLYRAPEMLRRFLQDRALTPATCSVLVRREAFERTGLFEERFTGLYEDQAYFLKAYSKLNVYLSDTCTDLYRQHPDSHSAEALRMGRYSTHEPTPALVGLFLWLTRYLVVRRVVDPVVWAALLKKLTQLGRHRTMAVVNRRFSSGGTNSKHLQHPVIAVATTDSTPRHPTLSVLMIAYNVAPYIAEALDSVLMQEVDFDYEIVVGEDCSTDGTRQILLDYSRRYPNRIRPLLRERNLGMNRNFMETLLAVRGEFVALLDGDDFWSNPRKLQRQVDFLRAHPDLSICFHNAQVVYEGESQASHPFHMPVPAYLISHHVPKAVSTISDLAGGNFMQTCSVVFRAGLYDRLPEWYLSMPTFDWPLHLLNSEHGDIGYIDEVMGVYRVRPGSFWSTDMALYRRVEDVESMIRAYEIVNAYTRFRFDATIQDQLRPLYRRAAEVLIGTGQHRRAARYSLRGWTGSGDRRSGHRRESLKLFLRSIRSALIG